MACRRPNGVWVQVGWGGGGGKYGIIMISYGIIIINYEIILFNYGIIIKKGQNIFG